MGVKGHTDITAIIQRARDGLGITGYIEVKTGSGKLSKPQQKFRDMVIRLGAPYCLARSVADALEFRERVASG